MRKQLSNRLTVLFCCVQMVLVMKKEVVKTNNSAEHEDTGKYRQLLVRTLHQCSVKFPDVAASIIPIVSTDRHNLYIRVPSGTWKTWRFEFYLSGSRNSLEFDRTKWEILEKIRHFAENMLKIYSISILYWENFVQDLCSSDFRTPLASAFWCKNCPYYNLENGHFDLDKIKR